MILGFFTLLKIHIKIETHRCDPGKMLLDLYHMIKAETI